MSEKRKLLIIDDDKVWQAFLSAALQSNYQIITAYDGEIGLKLAREWSPDTILLDIEMPAKDGFEVCAALKADSQLRNIPVIFVSSKSNLQEKINAFKLGADDYFVKPCEAELLSVKIARSANLYREKKALDEKALGAQTLAFEAMNSSADLGRSLRFAERTYVMQSLDKLAEGLFQTMAEFGLDTSVMFITQSGPYFYAQNKHELSPLEKDMFLAIHKEGRFCDFGNRTFCNFKLVSLLIKNMPDGDPERYGRIKDTVPWILGVADGKVGSLDIQNAILAQHEHVSAQIKTLQEILHRALLDANQIELEMSDNSPSKNNLIQGLFSALILLEALATEQARTNELISDTQTNNTAIELGSQEIFSSDVHFF